MLMPTRGNPIRRMSGIFLRLLSSIVCHYVKTIEDNKLRESLHTNRASFAIALGKSVAADLLRFADKSAHQVRSSTSVVSHDMRVRVSLFAPKMKSQLKNCGFFNF